MPTSRYPTVNLKPILDRLDEINGRLDSLEQGQNGILGRLDSLEQGQRDLRGGQERIADMLSTQVIVNQDIEKHLRRISGDPGLYVARRREAAVE